MHTFNMMDKKTLSFEYFISLLINWRSEKYGDISSNDFSTLKVLKLLFFCSAINAEENSENTLLDSPFDNFYAMPYGHVESDIYNSIRKNELQFYEISNSQTIVKNKNNFNNLSPIIKEQIDISFKKLVKINPELFEMTPLELVELSHQWYSWKFYYSKAKQSGSFSAPIPPYIIKSEDKFLFID